MKNVLPVGSVVRQPRGLIQVNGNTMPGWISWSVDSNTFHDPDKASVTFAVAALPNDYPPSWFAQETELDIEIFAGFPADPTSFDSSDLTSIFYGRADEASVSWHYAELELSCRDLTAQLLDTKTSEKYRNSKASDVANAMAAKYGLTAVVTATTGLIGRFYSADHTDLQSDRTEWDLLTWLARQEGFIVYVQGHELHFEPSPAESQDPYVVDGTPGALSVVTLKTIRVLTVARDIAVTVTSFNGKAKSRYSKKAVRNKHGSGQVQQYSYTIAGLTPEQTQDRANQILDELSRHEMRLEFSGPADNLLQLSDVIELRGTATNFDQTYFPDNIHRQMSFDGGYDWRVTAKNHSPESEPTI